MVDKNLQQIGGIHAPALLEGSLEIRDSLLNSWVIEYSTSF
jgi:hypothetical protein